MSCPPPDRLDLYIEGELNGTESREFEAHLAACPACRRDLEERRLLARAWSSLPPIEVPDNFAQAVMARLTYSPRAGFGRLVSAVIGVAALFAALLGFYLATGQSLADLLGAVWQNGASFFGLFVPLAAKLFMLVRLLLDLVGEFGTAVLHGLGVLSPLLGPGVVGAVLVLGSVLVLLAAFGFRKIVSLGERP
jgi:anti-sigma factor RsiW